MRPAPGRGAGAAAVALLLDEALGEPPVRWHPVVLMGRYLDRVGRRLPAGPPGRAVALGGVAWLVGTLATTVAVLPVLAAARRLPWPAAVLLEGAWLWPLLSGRMLRAEVADVETALARSLTDGRVQVGRLVSRDTAALDASQVRGAALGSLSENLCDSVVAPLLAHAVAGLPGAAAYRFVNTADAMWGYRDPRRLHAGRVAARADDLANLVPARLSALLLVLLGAGSPGRAVAVLRRLPAQARLTPSPNGGWPMGATALLLDVVLDKPGVYRLHPDGRSATTASTTAALRLAAALGPVAWAVLWSTRGAARRSAAAAVRWSAGRRPDGRAVVRTSGAAA